LLEKQEDILYEEHDKLVNVEKSLALEVNKNEILSSELSSCVTPGFFEGKPNVNHVRAKIRNSRTHRLHNWTSSDNARNK
jgi:hypothetical protein